MTAVKPLPADLVLAAGDHSSPEEGMCMVEAASYIAGEEFSDQPECVSSVIAAFCRSWNDALNDEDRNRLLLPYVPKIIGTRTTEADEETRAWLATDWLVRFHAPAWLRLAGLTEHAQALESLARITDATLARSAQSTLYEALAAASAAAWDAASAAARDAARAAARDAAWIAARAAAWDAARAAARDAARDAAWIAASAAASQPLRPTVEALQGSARGLLDAMIAVGRPGDAS